jgi:hypothetical protein
MRCIGQHGVANFLDHYCQASDLTLHGLNFLRVIQHTSKGFLKLIS